MKHWSSSFPLALAAWFLSYSPALAAEPDIKLDDTGRWSVPLRYWYHPTLFENADGFAFLAEVSALGPQPASPAPDNLSSPEFRKGELKILELLSRGTAVPARMADVRTLDVEGTSGLKVGDRLIVLIGREPYEGGYVIDHHEGDCALGILLSPTAGAKLNAEEEGVLLEWFRWPNFAVSKLNAEQTKIWKKIDSKGVTAALESEIRNR